MRVRESKTTRINAYLAVLENSISGEKSGRIEKGAQIMGIRNEAEMEKAKQIIGGRMMSGVGLEDGRVVKEEKVREIGLRNEMYKKSRR